MTGDLGLKDLARALPRADRSSFSSSPSSAIGQHAVLPASLRSTFTAYSAFSHCKGDSIFRYLWITHSYGQISIHRPLRTRPLPVPATVLRQREDPEVTLRCVKMSWKLGRHCDFSQSGFMKSLANRMTCKWMIVRLCIELLFLCCDGYVCADELSWRIKNVMTTKRSKRLISYVKIMETSCTFRLLIFWLQRTPFSVSLASMTMSVTTFPNMSSPWTNLTWAGTESNIAISGTSCWKMNGIEKNNSITAKKERDNPAEIQVSLTLNLCRIVSFSKIYFIAQKSILNDPDIFPCNSFPKLP